MSTQPPQAFRHGAVRIPGKIALLPDTGAVYDLSGIENIIDQQKHCADHGEKVRWQMLPAPKTVAGIGDNAKRCTHRAIVPVMYANGERGEYAPPVISGQSGVPSLLGLSTMAAENTYFGTKDGLMAKVPIGQEGKIGWPEGTTFIQCEKAASGHWMQTISNFGGSSDDVAETGNGRDSQ